MADIRLYMNVNRVSAHLFTNVGAEFSNSTSLIATLGLGCDIHTVKDQCVNVSLGAGLGSWDSADSELMGSITGGAAVYEKCDGLVFTIKLGYSF